MLQFSPVARPLAILVTGNTVPSVREERGTDFPEWIVEGTGHAWSGDWSRFDVRDGGPLPEPEHVAGLVITGSASSVTERAPWMLRAEAYLRAAVAAGAPVLGICFGHQLLAQALGGNVTRNPRGRELGTVTLHRHDGARVEPLFHGLPAAFAVNASHVDTVDRLPPNAMPLASTTLEPNAAFVVGERAYGVQFHPEFDGDIVRGYVRARSQPMRDEGLDPDHALSTAADTPHGRAVLANFVRACVRG